jgi:hypothetical protein
LSSGSKEERTNHGKGQKKRGQIIERVNRKEDKPWKGSKEKITNYGKDPIVCPLFC